MFVTWLLACGPRSVDGTDKAAPTADTGTTTPTFVLGCRPEPGNAVRALCGFERDGTGPIEVTLTGAGEPPRVFAGDPEQLTGEIVGYGLRADTDWEWTITDRGAVIDSGTFTAPPLPAPYTPLVSVALDGPSSVDHLLFSMKCGGEPALFVLDAQSRVRWYQPAGDVGFISAFERTERGGVAALMSRQRVGEWSWGGALLTDAVYPYDLPHRVHHAIQAKGDALYTLDAQLYSFNGVSYVIDGLTEVTNGAGVHVWDTRQILDPIGEFGKFGGGYWTTIFPNSTDFAHMNSFDLQEDGGFLFTLKHLDTVGRTNADGSLRWYFLGRPHGTTFFAPELEVSSSAGLDTAFENPHHGSVTPWGTVLVFDNGDRLTSPTSRVVEFAVDEDAGSVDLVRAWELGVTCPVQSSVYPLEDGTLLATCAATKQIFELDEGGIRRSATLSCADDGPASSFVRVRPIAFD